MAAEDVGMVSKIPTATDIIIPIRKGCNSVAIKIREETKFIAKTKDGYFVVDGKGKELSEPFADDIKIKSYNDKLVVTLTGKEYGVYDYEGNLLNEPSKKGLERVKRKY